MVAALTAALNELSVQCTSSAVPEDVYRLFPNWNTELPRTAQRNQREFSGIMTLTYRDKSHPFRHLRINDTMNTPGSIFER